MLRLDDKLRVTDILEEYKSRVEEGQEAGKRLNLFVLSPLFSICKLCELQSSFLCAAEKKKGSRVEFGGEGGDG